MKIRTGFVSNSSSSSFVIPRNHLSEDQIDAIMNMQDEDPSFDYSWSVMDDGNELQFYTSMTTNWDIFKFLRRHGVNTSNLEDDGFMGLL